jgi:hypothetical protein
MNVAIVHEMTSVSFLVHSLFLILLFFMRESGNCFVFPSSLSYSNQGTKYGHGGFIFIDQRFQNKESAVFLNFLFENDGFKENEAPYERDIYGP